MRHESSSPFRQLLSFPVLARAMEQIGSSLISRGMASETTSGWRDGLAERL